MISVRTNDTGNNIKDAQEIWHAFYARYHLHLPDEKKPENSHIEPDTNLRVPVIVPNDKSMLSEEIHYLLNGLTVLKSSDTKKITILKSNLDAGNIDAPIFYDHELPYLAMSLYTEGSICFHQFSSLLERKQIDMGYTPRGVYKLLNNKNELSNVAKTHLLPQINKDSRFKKIEGDAEKYFCSLIAALPPSEQYFYAHGSGPFAELGFQLWVAKLIHYDSDKKYILNLSAGARDALGIVRFGIDHYAMTRIRLGVQTLKDIEEATKHHFRPAAIAYPDTKAFDKIHGFIVSYYIAFVHDVYHSLIISNTPINIREILFHISNIIRQLFSKMHFSKEIWNIFDFEFVEILKTSNFVTQKALTDVSMATRMLSEMLTETQVEYINNTDVTVPNYYKKGNYLILDDQSLSPIGAAIFINMLNHPDIWLNQKINPEQLKSPFYDYYQLIKNNWDIIKHEHQLMMIFNCQILFALKSIKKEEHLGYVINLIAEHPEYLQLNFSKIIGEKERIKFKRHTNTIVTVIRGEKITNNKQINAVIQDFLNHHGYKDQWKKLTAKPYCQCFSFLGKNPSASKLKQEPLKQELKYAKSETTLFKPRETESKSTKIAPTPSVSVVLVLT